MSFWDMFYQACIKKGTKPNPVGKKIGVSSATITKWKQGTTPNGDTIKKIAEVLDVSTDYLLGRDPQPLPSNIESVDVINFPVIGSIAAGYNSLAIEEFTGETIQIPSSMLKGRSPKDFFVLRVKGDSMYPRFLEGDFVLVKRCTSVDSGSIAVVLYDNEATLKKVNYVYGEDWLELIPINPEYTTKHISGEVLEQCRILGLAINLIRKI